MNQQSFNLESKHLSRLPCVVWILLVLISLGWNIHHTRQEHINFLQDNARLIFKHILLVRRWNADHGGVYLPLTESTPPNEYLKIPNRVITTQDGVKLTLINPAYMTRQIAELAELSDGIKLHITSLDPIRPENKPTKLEQEALLSFETEDSNEFVRLTEVNNVQSFFYMAPLVTTTACLKCHEQQKYKEGDIRGGISVTLPDVHPAPIRYIILTHGVIGAIGMILILALSRKLSASYDEVRQLSLFDALTGIPNRRHFNQRLASEYKRSSRSKSPLTLLICDIDHFKYYNDQLGHLEGDNALAKVASAIHDSLQRGGDLCARYGGEEFTVILPDTDQSGGFKVAKRIQQKVASLKLLNPALSASESVESLTVSIGIATESNDYPSEEQLIKSADNALYRSKNNGRNRIEQDFS
ncbi:MAG: diguanylate cyclase [Candidatus Thiodiazotropha sp.]|jgi:diguanylate cyclase (GGDEF)-like protein